ncbi:MAG: flavodoxin-dependent (E)-4-hydroxy-3-methylbut-2-enyl-diphosphate synthase [Christensenellales bacterium]
MDGKTRSVRIGGVFVGGGGSVLIQSMTNTDTVDTKATIAQIERLCDAGCEAVRCAFYSEACAPAFKEIKKHMRVPLIADVHFDANLALLALKNGADKVRINPGNLKGEGALFAVADCAKSFGAALRIGVNAGSLERRLLEKHGSPTAKALAQSAADTVEKLYGAGFFDAVVSIKASYVPVCVKACRIFSRLSDAPMHIGITEAGAYDDAVVKSAVGLGALLLDGIGDTIRVSVTGDPVREIKAAKQILQSAGRRTFYPEVISCPTCARTRIDVEGLSQKVKVILNEKAKPLKAAVMGCVVNGPGEARHADIGIAGGDGKAALFAKGELVGTYGGDDILDAFSRYIDEHF